MVTLAVWFQVALVGLLVLVVGVMIAEAIHYDGLIDEAARFGDADPSEVSGERDGNVAFVLLFGLPMVVLALWLGLTVAWLRRGSHVARVLTWVGLGAPVGLFVLSCLFGGMIGLFGLLAFSSLDEPVPGEEDYSFEDGDVMTPEDAGFYDRLYDLDSGGWSIAYDAVLACAVAAAVLLAIATAVLLLTGPADRFFRPGRHFPQGPQPFRYAGAPPSYPDGFWYPAPPPPPPMWASQPQPPWGPQYQHPAVSQPQPPWGPPSQHPGVPQPQPPWGMPPQPPEASQPQAAWAPQPQPPWGLPPQHQGPLPQQPADLTPPPADKPPSQG